MVLDRDREHAWEECRLSYGIPTGTLGTTLEKPEDKYGSTDSRTTNRMQFSKVISL